MPNEDPHLNDDLLVNREKILEMFDPEPSRSTFFDWVNKGTIVKARGIQGFYLLNASRKKLRMPPLDVSKYRKEEILSEDRRFQILYTAMSMLVPEIVAVINEVEFPEVLTPSEITEIRRLIEAHRESLAEQGEVHFRMAYCRAVLDAEKINQKIDGN